MRLSVVTLHYATDKTNSALTVLMVIITSVQSNLTKAHITILSPVMTEIAFICCMQWTGTFASSGRQTVHDELMHRYFTMARVSLEVPLPAGSGSASNVWFLGLTQVILPNSISISSVTFAQLTHMPNTQTHKLCYMRHL